MGNATLNGLGVIRHALDDYLLLLLLDEATYAEFVRRDHKTNAPEFAAFRSALQAAVNTLRERGVEVTTAKQVVDLACAIIGFRASPAALAARLMECASEDAMKVLEGLVGAVG